MFEQGKSYRVFLSKGDELTKRVGDYVSMNAGLLVLDVEGVKTAFHLAGGVVAYVEEVNEAAEEARTKARGDRYVQALS